MNPLSDLKKYIQSINQNITDDDIANLQSELALLGTQYKDDPTITSFIKMMRSLGKYLGVKKNNAHPDSIPVLNSIVDQLDTLIENQDLESDEAEQILSRQIQQYKSLKDKIASRPEIIDSDINDLKAVILALDWEVSDTNLQNFETVVTHLLSKLEHYKIHRTFLKIILSIGRYIGTQKANARIDSISLLGSVFKSFNQILQNPDMPLKDRNQILKTDINRFQEFKQKISQKQTETQATPQATEDISDYESFQPALSHVESAGTQGTDDFTPLTTLPDQDNLQVFEESPDPDGIGSEAAEPEKPPEIQKDIMDDLFTVKESPADELLDAIHMLDVQGQNNNASATLPDQENDLQSDGTKNFTPERLDIDPIPEIENRLDEFFNLDVPQTPPSVQNADPVKVNEVLTIEQDPESASEEVIETAKVMTVEDADSPEDITPENITPEDIAPENITPIQDDDNSSLESPGDAPLPQSPESAILNRLRSTVETSEWLKYKSSLLSINEDISSLENHWKDDPDKTCLLQIISLTISMLKGPEKTSGIMGKIKGLFTS